jgi:hypothetical protein
MHALDLILHLLYLVALIRFVTYPPGAPTLFLPTFPLLEAFIIAYAIGSLVRSTFYSFIPSVLVLLSFVICFPTGPIPGDVSYNFLLVAIVMYLIGLHLPSAPNPIFLSHLKHTVPLSVFLWDSFKRAFCPILFFFIPVVLLSVYLLSFSLANTLFQGLQSVSIIAPAPIETRATFLTFVAIVLTLFVTSLILSTLNFSSLSGPGLDPWDRYSPRIGFESRRAFAQVVAKYSAPRYFPTPFNLIPLLLIKFPALVFRVMKRSEWREHLWRVEEGIWMILVMPLSMLSAGIWLWGYR